MALKAISTNEIVTGNTFSGSAGPITPRSSTSGVMGVDEYFYSFPTNSTTLNGEGALKFQTGTSIVIGDPVVNTNVNLTSTPTLTNQNAPYNYFPQTPDWDAEISYSVGDLVDFNGTAYTCTTDVVPNPERTSFSIGFDNTVGSTGVNTGQQGITFGGFPAGTVSKQRTALDAGGNPNGTVPSTYTNFRIQNDNTRGLYEQSATQVNIFGFTRIAAQNINQWITHTIEILNDPSISDFRPEDSDFFNFVTTQAAVGGVTTMTFTPRLTTVWPSTINFVSSDFPPYITDSFAVTTIGGNDDPTIATGSWSQTGTLIVNSWVLNSSSIVPLNTEGYVTNDTDMTVRVLRQYDSDSGDGLNFTMIQSDDTACAPVFYGVNFCFDTTQATPNMNLIGQANSSVTGSDGQAIAQLYNCAVTMLGSSDFRFLGDRYLLNGLDYTSYGTAGTLVFGKASIFAPRGIKYSLPNVTNLRNRTGTVHCEGGSVTANDKDYTYVFENPSMPNFSTFVPISGLVNADEDVGLLPINATDCPPIPYANLPANLLGSVTKPIPLGTRDTSFITYQRTMNNAAVFCQRVKIATPTRPGQNDKWTFRVIKSATNTLLQDRSEAKTVLWQGNSRTSNGALVTSANTTFNTTTEYFGTSGDPVITNTAGNGTRNLKVLQTANDNNLLESNDVPVYFSFDGDGTGQVTNLILPTHSGLPFPSFSTTETDQNYFFYSYKIIAQNDYFGTKVFNITFDPLDSNFPTGMGEEGWNNLELSANDVALDSAFVTPFDLSADAFLNFQQIYDGLKTFQRERDSDTAYASSHRTSDATFLTRTDKEFHTIEPNWSRILTGRAVQTDGTTLGLKTVNSFAAGSLTNVDSVTITGNMDMEIFRANSLGLIINCATATNLSGNLAGTLTNSSASTTTNNIVITKTGTLNGDWTLTGVSTDADELISANSNGAWSVSGVLNHAGQHTGNINLTTTGVLAHSIGGSTTGNITSNSTGTTSVSGTITGNYTGTSGLLTTSPSTNITGTTTVGAGNLFLRGEYGGKVTAGNATTFHNIDATITSGGLELGTSSADANLIQGTITAPVTVGNGNTTIDATVVGDITTGNGLTISNGTLTGNWTAGTSEFILDASSRITGTLTKSGSGDNNRLTVNPGAIISGIDLVVPSGTLQVYGVSTGFNSVTGNVNFNDLGTTTTTFQVGSGLPSGRVILKKRIAGRGVFIKDVAHTAGTVTALSTFANSSSSPTDYDIYYKPTNVTGPNGVFYQTTFIKSDNSATTNRTIDVTANAYAGSLIEPARGADLTGLSATMGTVTTSATANIIISGATLSQIDSIKTQALMLRVTDDANYLNLLANNNADIDFILPFLQSGTTINQTAFTLIASIQQLITAVIGTGTGTLIGTITVGTATFPSVFIFPNSVGLTGLEAEAACKDALDANDLTKTNVDGIIAQNTTIPAANQADLDARELTKVNVDGIIAQNTTIPAANQADLDARDLTKVNVDGIIAQNTTIPAANQADLDDEE